MNGYKTFQVWGETYAIARWGDTAEVRRTADDFLMGTLTRNEDRRWGCRKPYIGSFVTTLAAAKKMVERWNHIVFDPAHAHEVALGMNKYHDEEKARKAKQIAEKAARAKQILRERDTRPMLTVTYRTWDQRNPDDPYQVVLYGDGHQHGYVSIEVDRGPSYDWEAKKMVDKAPHAVVNWSGWGSTEPKRAREYALAILRAADEAEAFNRRGARVP